MLSYFLTVVLIALVPVSITNKSIPDELSCMHIEKSIEHAESQWLKAVAEEDYWLEKRGSKDPIYQHYSFKRHYHEYHLIEYTKRKREVCNVL